MDLKDLNAPLPKPWLNPQVNSLVALTSNVNQVTTNLLTLTNESNVPNPPVSSTTLFSSGLGNLTQVDPSGTSTQYATTGFVGNYLPLNGSQAMQGNLDMGTHNILNVASIQPSSTNNVMGSSSSTGSLRDVVIGNTNVLDGDSNDVIAIGSSLTTAHAFNSVIIGNNTSSSKNGNVIVGQGSSTGTGINNVVVGQASSVTGTAKENVVVGQGSTSSNDLSVAVGFGCTSTGVGSVCVGSGCNSTANHANCLGSGLGNTTANTLLVDATANIRSNSNGTCDLGAVGASFNNVYASGSLIGSLNTVAVNNVVGNTGVSISGDLCSFSDTSGKVIQDSGVLAANVVTNTGTNVAGDIPSFSGTTGKIITDSGILAANIVTSAGAGTSGNVTTFTGSGKVVQDSGTALSSLATNAGVAATYLPLSGGTMTNAITMGNNQINSVKYIGYQANASPATPAVGFVNVYETGDKLKYINSSASTFQVATTTDLASYLLLAGGIMQGDIAMNSHNLTNVNTLSGASTSRTVDNIVSNAGAASAGGNLPTFTNTGGKVIQDSGVLLSSLATNAALANYLLLSGASAMTGNLNMNSHSITNGVTCSLSDTCYVQNATYPVSYQMMEQYGQTGFNATTALTKYNVTTMTFPTSTTGSSFDIVVTYNVISSDTLTLSLYLNGAAITSANITMSGSLNAYGRLTYRCTVGLTYLNITVENILSGANPNVVFYRQGYTPNVSNSFDLYGQWSGTSSNFACTSITCRVHGQG